VAITLQHPAADAWKTLVAEAPGKAVLEHVVMVDNQFAALWMTDAHHALRLCALHDRPGADLHPNRNEAGHGAGKPTEKVIEERADKFGFLVRELHMALPEGFGR
jgi:hypothetical protein